MHINHHERAADAIWIDAAEAVSATHEAVGGIVQNAREFLIRRAGSDMILTRCALMKRRRTSGRGTPFERKDVLISFEFWEQFEKRFRQSVADWRSGDFELTVTDKWGDRDITKVVAVQFSARDLLAQLPKSAKDKVASNAPIDAVARKQEEPERKRGRNLSHNHPFAAAMAALQLAQIPGHERERLTGPSVGKTMEVFYRERHQDGKAPADDNLDDFGASVLAALKRYWGSQEG